MMAQLDAASADFPGISLYPGNEEGIQWAAQDSNL